MIENKNQFFFSLGTLILLGSTLTLSQKNNQYYPLDFNFVQTCLTSDANECKHPCLYTEYKKDAKKCFPRQLLCSDWGDQERCTNNGCEWKSNVCSFVSSLPRISKDHGCACKKVWSYQGETCENSCCPLAGFPDWCATEGNCGYDNAAWDNCDENFDPNEQKRNFEILANITSVTQEKLKAQYSIGYVAIYIHGVMDKPFWGIYVLQVVAATNSAIVPKLYDGSWAEYGKIK